MYIYDEILTILSTYYIHSKINVCMFIFQNGKMLID
jgi:hypothetical protein